MNPPLLGVDIDDTIADWSETPPYAATPSPDSVRVLNAWQRQGRFTLLYITSRSRTRAEETIGWLQTHGYPVPTQVIFEEDCIGGKPDTLLQRQAIGLIDDMPGTMADAAAKGLLAFWRDLPKNERFERPAPHPCLKPWQHWAALETLLPEACALR